MHTWIAVAAGGLLVFGAACVLAGMSWASWVADVQAKAFSAAMASREVMASCYLGLAAASAGLLLRTAVTIERVLWAAFVVWFLVQVRLALSDLKRTKPVAPWTYRILPTSSCNSRLLCTASAYVLRAELWLLAALTPLLMFPTRVTAACVALLGLPWLARKLKEGRFSKRSPMDGPILLLVIMLPIGLWASMDMQRSLPKFYGIVLGLAVFYTIVNRVRDSAGASQVGLLLALSGPLVSLVALLGTKWPAGLPVPPPQFVELAKVLTRLAGSQAIGFNPNQVAAALTLFVPFCAGLLLFGWHAIHPRLRWLLVVGLCVMMATLLITRSVSALVAVGIGLLSFSIWNRRLRWLVVALLCLMPLLVWFWIQHHPAFAGLLAMALVRSLRPRIEIWQRALYIIRDYPATGAGLNGFALRVNTLYPVLSVLPQQMLVLTHAHNELLQVAADFGVPGLVAHVALYLCFGGVCWGAYQRQRQPSLRALCIALLCANVSFHVYGLADCITLGAKPGVVLWAMLGLSVALYGVPPSASSFVS